MASLAIVEDFDKFEDVAPGLVTGLIAAKIREIERLADELLQDMPKTKSRQGAIGLD